MFSASSCIFPVKTLPFGTECQYSSAHRVRHRGRTKTEENTVRDDTAPTVGPDAEIDTELVEEESLVEEVSIDGMCGVY